MTKERKDQNGGRWESGEFFFLNLFIQLYIVGHPFKKYILFGWTYSCIFKNAAIGPPFKNAHGPIAAFSIALP